MPVDPRPSKAHPEHRATRKKIEKAESAFGWMPVFMLGLMGITIFMNLEKDVQKHEKKHEEEEAREEERQREQRRAEMMGGGEGPRRGGSQRGSRDPHPDSRGRRYSPRRAR